MRVLLIYSNQSKELVPAPPVGVSYVASATQAAGHEVKLLDLAFADDLMRELGQAIESFKPEVVGLSIRNIDNVIHQRFDSPMKALQSQTALIREKALLENGQPVPLVLGGPAISILAEKALDLFGADFAVVGEGETVFPQLLEHFSNGNHDYSTLPGLCYRKGEQPCRNKTELLEQIGQSGMPQWVQWKRYEQGGGTWPMQTKRGCPFRCSYCAYPLVEGRKIRLREPGEIVDEIEQVIRDAGPRCFEFVDSTFNVPSNHALAVCEEIIRRRIKASFSAMGINPRDVPAELFPTMKRAGFNSMMITPEAASETMLREYQKGFTMDHVRSTMQHARKSELKSMWFFMLGGPGETMETVEETVSFAERELRGLNFLSVFFTGVRILPDTALAKRAIEEGTIAADTDLTQGVFYLSKDMPETTAIDRLNQAIVRNPSIVHAAEGSTTKQQRQLYSLLHKLRIAPPYWRYLPMMLHFPPTRFLRSRFPQVMIDPAGDEVHATTNARVKGQ